MRYWYSEQRGIAIHFWFLIGDTEHTVKSPLQLDPSLMKLVRRITDCVPGCGYTVPEIITQRFSIRSQHYEHLVAGNYAEALAVINQINVKTDDRWSWRGDYSDMIGD